MSDLQKVLLHDKPVKILLSLKRGNRPKYASILSRDANCTYSHTVKILNLFRENNLVVFEKEGRKKIIRLTGKGQIITTTLEELIIKLEKSK